jgi:hypothetical protein
MENDQPDDKSNVSQSDMSVRLRVEYPADVFTPYCIKRSTRFEKLIKAFCSHNNLTSTSGLRFHLDGQRIQATEMAAMFSFLVFYVDS